MEPYIKNTYFYTSNLIKKFFIHLFTLSVTHSTNNDWTPIMCLA